MSLSYPDPNCSVCEKKDNYKIYTEAKEVMDYCSDYSGPYPISAHNPKSKDQRFR